MTKHVPPCSNTHLWREVFACCCIQPISRTESIAKVKWLHNVFSCIKHEHDYRQHMAFHHSVLAFIAFPILSLWNLFILENAVWQPHILICIHAASLFSLDKSTVPSFILTPGLKARFSQASSVLSKDLRTCLEYASKWKQTRLCSLRILHVRATTNSVCSHNSNWEIFSVHGIFLFIYWVYWVQRLNYCFTVKKYK